MVMTSGSTYVVGCAVGLKSRGGLVIVLAGSAGFPEGACALATIGTRAVAPAPVPIAVMKVRRETTLPLFIGGPPRPARCMVLISALSGVTIAEGCDVHQILWRR